MELSCLIIDQSIVLFKAQVLKHQNPVFIPSVHVVLLLSVQMMYDNQSLT